ncbi:MAG: hypothetical protein EZS28_048990, partial [Streblomastix strix]
TKKNEKKTDSITKDIEKEQDEIDAIAVDKEEDDDETDAIATDKQKEKDETNASNNNNLDLEDAEMEMEKEEDETGASNSNKDEFEDADTTAMNKDIVRDGNAVKRKREPNNEQQQSQRKRGRPRKCQGGERIGAGRKRARISCSDSEIIKKGSSHYFKFCINYYIPRSNS